MQVHGRSSTSPSPSLQRTRAWHESVAFSPSPTWHSLNRAGSCVNARSWSVAAGQQLCLLPCLLSCCSQALQGLHQFVNLDPAPEGPNFTGCPLVKGHDNNPLTCHQTCRDRFLLPKPGQAALKGALWRRERCGRGKLLTEATSVPWSSGEQLCAGPAEHPLPGSSSTLCPPCRASQTDAAGTGSPSG